MEHTAKLFMNGRSQAVRLPASYRFEGSEVYIRRDPDSGDIIISKRPESWDGFFMLQGSANIPEDFMNERDNDPIEDKDLF